jgi:hypothetical protein
MITSRAKKWIRAWLEKLIGCFYEGEVPPQRLREIVTVWANEHPHATRAEWLTMVEEWGDEVYRSAFLRGVEYVERDPTFWKDIDPDLIADEIDPDWRWRPEVKLDGDPDFVPIEDELPQLEDILIDLEREQRDDTRFLPPEQRPGFPFVGG